MTSAQRRNACPSIDAPMRTGDGLLVRITPARGYFEPDELLAITKAAESCGNGAIEVSTRGNLQVRGLRNESTAVFRSRIVDAGIEVASGVAIVSNPLAGFDPSEVYDASKLHCLLRDEIAKSKISAGLGPKISVVIDGGGQLNLSQLIADIRIKAVTQGNARWQLSIAGSEAKSRCLGLVRDDSKAISAIMLLLKRIALRGPLARGRDLDDDDLVAAMEVIEPSTGPETSTGKTHAAAKKLPPIGLFNLQAGGFALGIGLPFGITSAAELAVFAQAVQDAGATHIRPAPGKAILVTGLDAEAAEDLMAAAGAMGFIIDAGDPRASIVTCAGKPACNSAHIETRSLATHVASEFATQLVGTAPIHISGCDKGCANPGSPSLEIIGTADGYRVRAGACSEVFTNSEDLSGRIARALQSKATPITTATATTANRAERNLRT